jgi:hypothetical protein
MIGIQTQLTRFSYSVGQVQLVSAFCRHGEAGGSKSKLYSSEISPSRRSARPDNLVVLCQRGGDKGVDERMCAAGQRGAFRLE